MPDNEAVAMTGAEQDAAQIAHAILIVSNPANKGSIEHWGAMFLLAQKGRVDKLAAVRSDLEQALMVAGKNLRKG